MQYICCLCIPSVAWRLQMAWQLATAQGSNAEGMRQHTVLVGTLSKTLKVALQTLGGSLTTLKHCNGKGSAAHGMRSTQYHAQHTVPAETLSRLKLKASAANAWVGSCCRGSKQHTRSTTARAHLQTSPHRGVGKKRPLLRKNKASDLAGTRQVTHTGSCRERREADTQ